MNNKGKFYRETFKFITTNAAQLNAGATICLQDRLNAEKNKNLPHNQLYIGNQDTTCTLFIFLDNFTDATKPDYIIFPSQQMVINVEEGITFTHVWIKNTHGASNIAANALKIKISTVKRV